MHDTFRLNEFPKSNLYEYKVDKPSPPKAKEQLSNHFHLGRVFSFIFANVVALGVLCAIGFGMAMAINGAYKYNHLEHCTLNSDCDSSLGLICSDGVCECLYDYYWYSGTQKCEARGTYNASCTTIPCLKSLTCTNGICKCNATEYWVYSSYCFTSRNYNESCNSSEQCWTGLTCTNNICNCSSGYFWNGTNCEPAMGYGSYCQIAQGTYSNLACTTNLTCALYNEYAGYCSCATNYYYNTYCLPKKLNGQTCTNNDQCRSDLGLYCNTSSVNVCTCNITSYWTGSTCSTKLSQGTACTTSSQCKDYLGLVCRSGYCNCSTGWYYNYNSGCIALNNYTDTCTYNYQCDTSGGMYCSVSTSLAACPTTLSQGHCDCYSWQYYSTGGVCTNKTSYFGQCDYNCSCLSGFGLYCNSTGRCTCATGYFWYSNTVGCRYCDTAAGFTIYTNQNYPYDQRCYYVGTTRYTWAVAQTTCPNLDSASTLVILTGNLDAYLLNSYTGAIGYNGNYWVGLQSNSLWLDGSSTSGYSWDSFNSGGGTRCGYFQRTGGCGGFGTCYGRVNDARCTSRRGINGYICQMI